MTRNEFLKMVLGLGLAPTLLTSCSKQKKPLVEFEKDHSAIGHLLREGFHIPAGFTEEHIDVAVIGSGVSALSACRYLNRHSHLKIHMYEMQDTIGGNAMAGENETSKYPWAAHYITTPNNNLTELIEFLYQHGVITSFTNNLPNYKDEYLCFEPKERLYIHQGWKQTIQPGIQDDDEYKKQINAFNSLIDSYKSEAFTIPINHSAIDPSLETMTAIDFLRSHHLTNEKLIWYVNYSLCDDYGCRVEQCSAYAMLLYFCSRNGKANNAETNSVLTWPEGTHFLANKLWQDCSLSLFTNHVALQINEYEKCIYIFNAQTKEYKKVYYQHLILNTPHHVTKKLLPSYTAGDSTEFEHYPWIVANIHIKQKTDFNHTTPAWDNVIYQSPGLGFVVANHQQLQAIKENWNFTYYKNFSKGTSKEERNHVRLLHESEIAKEIIDELKFFDENLEDNIESIKIKKLGHGMIAPVVGFLTSDTFKKYGQPYRNIYFCHTDYCGISIFEEGFYKGIQTAKRILEA